MTEHNVYAKALLVTNFVLDSDIYFNQGYGVKRDKAGGGIRATLASNALYTMPSVEVSALRCRCQVSVFHLRMLLSYIQRYNPIN